MARIHITSDETTHERLHRLSRDGGLTPDGTATVGGVSTTSYEKRAVPSDGLYEPEPNVFIAASGTVVHDGELGGEALSSVLKTFREAGPEGVRSEALGHYVIAVGIDDRVTVFCDPNSVYEVYYTDGPDWAVSDSLRLCAETLSDRRVDRFGLYERALEVAELSTETMYDGVRRLGARQQLIADTTTGELTVETLSLPERDWSYEGADFESVLTDYNRRARTVFAEIVDAAERTAIQATGGIDSRTVLAGLLSHGADPVVLYGVGNSQLTNTTDEDRQIAREYARRFDLKFHEMDWTGDNPLPLGVWDEYFSKYGFQYHWYGSTPGFYRSFEDGFPGSPELVLSGYGFGTFSNDYFWENDSQTPISFEDAVAELFTYTSVFDTDEFVCRAEYIDHLVERCLEGLEQLGEPVDPTEPLNIRELTRVVQLLNGRPQSAYVNVANRFTYHLSPFATYELGRAMIDFPPEVRHGERIRIRQLQSMYPELADIDVFSGRQWRTLTESGEIRPESETVDRLVGFAARALPRPLKRLVSPVYRATIGPSSDRPEVDERIFRTHRDRFEAVDVVDECFDLTDYEGDIRWPARLAQFGHAVESVRDGSTPDGGDTTE